MKKSFLMTFLCSLVLMACNREEWMDPPGMEGDRIVFKLQHATYDDEAEASTATNHNRTYDRLAFYVADPAGDILSNLKGFYNSATSEIHIEGLQEGEYTLLVLGIQGNADDDRATLREINHTAEPWLVFPQQLSEPLKADYFYSQTPFSVEKQPGDNGYETIVSAPGRITQRRIAGRADFSFAFRNPYIRTAVVQKSVTWKKATFYTELTGDGSLAGAQEIQLAPMAMDSVASFCLLPTPEGTTLQGEISVTTRDYRDNRVKRQFAFDMAPVASNRINRVQTTVVHPDDESGVMFLTTEAYREGAHARILQDDERKEVYTDAKQRAFDTSHPLQVAITDDGRLHVRFYSPRDLGEVLIRARFPSVTDEYIDLAYFDTIPAFADFFEPVPLFTADRMHRTASGKWLKIPKQELSAAAGATFEISSGDAYWKKLQDIQHGWKITFSLYGGDPDKPDGGPAGNWMGIRPVHCREAVAFFLNFTYMIDMQEHEEILRANEDRLYGNGGINDKVTAETVLQQMRQPRNIQVGLVYTGNNVLGLGGGHVFGAYQGAWLNHYTDTYACEIMFHELGHVMGYSHDSSFTYGPWAQELMNRFYVDHLHQMPIDSPHYLASKQNPHIYP